MTDHLPSDEVEERAAERARELAETVKQEALGVSETVKDEAGGVTDAAEQRAAELAAERVIQRTEERIESRSDIKGELQEITAAIGTLVEHMDQSLPEERVKQLAEAVLAEERLGRRRLTTKITGFLVVILLVAGSALIQSRANGDQTEKILALSQDAKTTADYVKHCLQGKTEGLTPAQIASECGSQSNGTDRVLKVVFCVLLKEPEVRVKADLAECYRRVRAGEFD